eukprot:10968115-Karenia_brevis.AAC.1
MNWSKGKSEAILRDRGNGAAAAYAKRRSDGKLQIRLPAAADQVYLHVVTCYKHVGSIASHSNSINEDALLRAESASRVYVPVSYTHLTLPTICSV